MFSWTVIGLLAWDLYDYGPSKSVAVNAGVTLARRVSEAGKSVPELMSVAIGEIHKRLTRHEDVASAGLFPFLYSRPATPAALNEDALWAIELASRRTGVSREYLITTAYMEANFDARAHSATSSAAGMYQIIDSTWLQLMAQHGHDYGWAGYAEQIACTSAGRCKYKGADGLTRVMDLRYDSMTATFLSAELARSNRTDLVAALGRDVTDAELYLAHFLGPAGAIALVRAVKATPDKAAAELFPAAAQANRTLFYRTRHDAYGCADFYAHMNQRWARAGREVEALARKSGDTLAASS